MFRKLPDGRIDCKSTHGKPKNEKNPGDFFRSLSHHLEVDNWPLLCLTLCNNMSSMRHHVICTVPILVLFPRINEKSTVPRKIIGTLTLSISHIDIPHYFVISYSMATPELSKPLPLENYVRVVALAPDLRKVSVCGTTGFLHHSSTIELLSLLILMKGSYPSFKVSYHAGKSSSALWLLRYANSWKVATRVGTSSQNDQRFLVSAKRPRTSHNDYDIIWPEVQARNQPHYLPCQVTPLNTK